MKLDPTRAARPPGGLFASVHGFWIGVFFVLLVIAAMGVDLANRMSDFFPVPAALFGAWAAYAIAVGWYLARRPPNGIGPPTSRGSKRAAKPGAGST